MIARLHLAAYVLLHGLPSPWPALFAAWEDRDYWQDRCADLLCQRPPLSAATQARIRQQRAAGLTLEWLAEELADVGTDPTQEARP
jgi:hypothetical protein